MLSIVLVNWNGWADTLSCVQSLLNAQQVPFRVVIVDNMSPNESLEAFERWAAGELELIRPSDRVGVISSGNIVKPGIVSFCQYREDMNLFETYREYRNVEDDAPEIHIVVSGRNGGFGFGCNVGMRLADQLGTDGYWLLNNDCVASHDALAKVARALETEPGTAFGTIVRYYDRPDVIQAVAGGWLSVSTGRNEMALTYPPKAPLNYIYGASFALSRNLRERVGYFDEKIFMYYEEMDYCIRILRAGFGFGVVDATVFHRHGGSQGGVSVSAWQNVLVNKWYVLRKHFGLGLWSFVYWLTLLARCADPRGGRNGAIGARRALKTLLARRASP